MAKKKKEPEQPAPINMDLPQTAAEPRAWVGDVPVFCAHDELVAIGKAVPNPRNPRLHPPEQIRLLAAIIKGQGFRAPVTISRRSGFIVKGHGRLQAAQLLGMEKIPIDFQNYANDAEEWADLIADNRINELADTDEKILLDLIAEMDTGEIPMEYTGYSDDEIKKMIDEMTEQFPDPGLQDDGFTGDVEKITVPMTKTGDIWLLGEHRVLCGDSTKPDAVGRLLKEETVDLLFTDPPYGMGKESDGVQNDNLTGSRLDAFLMEAWRAILPHMKAVASCYMWGVAEDLWRLWYVGGLKDSARLTIRNEIIWNKKHGQGMKSPDLRSYAPVTERCLFFMFGEQDAGGNAEAYWEGWEPIRAYLDGEREKMGWKRSDVERILGSVNKSQSIFSKSHFNLITEPDYVTLQKAADGKAFTRPYNSVEGQFHGLKDEWESLRAYFDNTHDIMTDVWDFDRVTGDERHGHATPKPIPLCGRAILSSTKRGEIVADLFGGSGSTMMACDQTGRKCRTMEIDPRYVDVMVERYILANGTEGVVCLHNGIKRVPYSEMKKRQEVSGNGKTSEG